MDYGTSQNYGYYRMVVLDWFAEAATAIREAARDTPVAVVAQRFGCSAITVKRVISGHPIIDVRLASEIMEHMYGAKRTAVQRDGRVRIDEAHLIPGNENAIDSNGSKAACQLSAQSKATQ